jgi:type II secretory pathway component GspD/PulD (secretin)
MQGEPKPDRPPWGEEDVEPATPAPIKPRTDIPITKLANGMVRINYRLLFYGGPLIKTDRNTETKERKVTTQPPNLQPLADLVKKNIGAKGDVTPLPSENALVITCPPEMQDSVLNLLAGVDNPVRQVEITARIFEVSHDFDFQLGARTLINHIASDNTQALASRFSAADFVGAVINPALGAVVDPGGALNLMQIMESCGITLDVTFHALASSGLVKVIAAPRMTVDTGQTAYMQAGQELPIQTAEIRTDGQLVTRKLVYKPIGVQLYITPQAAGRDSVKLHVATSLSAISGFSPLPTMDDAYEPHATVINPTIDAREAETYVTIANGSTLVIGGMKMVRTVSRESKIPGLGDIKYLGWLFKNHRSQKQVNDLYFFVTPKILR